jgi:DNA replication and repair protein RecF
MFVARLTLTDFRNHASTVLHPGAGLVVLAGQNGAGKTNILEALSLLAPGRGLRGAALADMIRDGAPGFAVAAELAEAGADLAPVAIGTATRADAAGRRRVRINGSDAAATSLAEWLSLLWLTPAMDRLFTEPASGRRRFLDRMTLALDPAHAGHAARYEAAVRARNRLLAEDAPPDPLWLDALETQMAEHGAAVDAARRALVAALAEETAAAPQTLFARPLVSLTGPDGAEAPAWDAASLQAALARSRTVDARAGRTLVGPHRADLAVVHADKGQAAARCSTGEQKALLLSLVLAHGDLVAGARGHRPLLLLDEVAAHLDPERRALLLARLAEGGGQVWMTGTEQALFASAPAGVTRFAVDSGGVSAV